MHDNHLTTEKQTNKNHTEFGHPNDVAIRSKIITDCYIDLFNDKQDIMGIIFYLFSNSNYELSDTLKHILYVNTLSDNKDGRNVYSLLVFAK